MTIGRIVIGLSVVSLGLGLTGRQAWAAEISSAAAGASQCVLQPGVYKIIDASGNLVGVLLVYPDCHTEIIKAVDNS
ncbi:hypothetical protein FHS01_005298 [Longimicrobium terrae]|uniref:Uncharacterized protein n=2 Tax=Longimicrobium terrae TaxID=1639882 RepID=A0A841H5R5_9BACT|nr:hypothetical protein [Longimicrobium terrae]MBB4639231.1 hypothetical protein [Longimicrobium terrae]MBB6073471.1 hypothetical protein [Longimicrobium terrae]